MTTKTKYKARERLLCKLEKYNYKCYAQSNKKCIIVRAIIAVANKVSGKELKFLYKFCKALFSNVIISEKAKEKLKKILLLNTTKEECVEGENITAYILHTFSPYAIDTDLKYFFAVKETNTIKEAKKDVDELSALQQKISKVIAKAESKAADKKSKTSNTSGICYVKSDKDKIEQAINALKAL